LRTTRGCVLRSHLGNGMKKSSGLLLLVPGLLFVACSSSPVPTSPSSSTAPAVSLVILGLENGAAVGRSLPLTAVATGPVTSPTTVTLGAIWTSSNPVVATVSAAGIVTPLAEGATVIGVAVKGGSTNQALRVYRNMEGTWEYSFFPTVCGSGGSSSGMGCRRFDGNVQLTHMVTVAQTGRLLLLKSAEPSRYDIFPGVKTVSGVIGEEGASRCQD
jgi:hypothetical protein